MRGRFEPSHLAFALPRWLMRNLRSIILVPRRAVSDRRLDGAVGRVWRVTFRQYDLGYFDDETCRLEPIENPFSPKVLPMSSE